MYVRFEATSSPILVTLLTEALRSSKTSSLKRVARRNVPEDDIFTKIYSRNCGETSRDVEV
jgi:hypothetical protein